MELGFRAEIGAGGKWHQHLSDSKQRFAKKGEAWSRASKYLDHSLFEQHWYQGVKINFDLSCNYDTFTTGFVFDNCHKIVCLDSLKVGEMT